jgi:hypothetical protein
MSQLTAISSRKSSSHESRTVKKFLQHCAYLNSPSFWISLAPLLLQLELIKTYLEQNKLHVEVRLISYVFAFYNFDIFHALEVM